MTSLRLENGVRVPSWVVDLKSFRNWATSDEFPERGRFSHLSGELWIDMSPARLFSHNTLQGEITAVLTQLIKRAKSGSYFPDNTLLTHEEAGLSTETDGTYVSWACLKAGRVVLVERKDDYVEVQGSPDMVLEIVSPSSVQKDRVVLPELYWRANIPEFWLVDARGDRLDFELKVHTPEGYAAAKKRDGWQKSGAFGRSFKLTRRWNKHGFPEYTLHVR